MFEFLNPWMLAGLIGIVLPALVHLLSRRRFDVVNWGAMQFLELSPRARRSLRLQDLLLLLIRIAMIALLALALARPWVHGSWLGGLTSRHSRDLVIIIDGSYSMAWEGKAQTPHARAQQWAHQIIDQLLPGDTVAIIDARDSVRVVTHGSTRDLADARKAIDGLSGPQGTSHLAEASIRGLQLLGQTSHTRRDLVILTDGQALGWNAEDDNFWKRWDDLREIPSIKPEVWVVDLGQGDLGKGTNVAIDRLRLSRELTVPDGPIRIQTRLRADGAVDTLTRQVFLEVDGQRLPAQTQTVRIPSEGETSIEFELTLSQVGTHVVSVSTESDALSADNQTHGVVVVTEAIPVLLIDGDQRVDPVRSETFFAKAALSSSGDQHSWIACQTIAPDKLTREDLRNPVVTFLANSSGLNHETTELLENYVRSGRGLVVTLGDHTVPAEMEWLTPLAIGRQRKDDAMDPKGVRVSNDSLKLPWLSRFRIEQGSTIQEARFSQWWTTTLLADASKSKETPAESQPEGVQGQALEAARLTTGDAWIWLLPRGGGTIAVLTSSLDADWNTLPAKADYVALLHELVFLLGGQMSPRNLEPGQPIILPLTAGEIPFECKCRTPFDKEIGCDASGGDEHPLTQYSETSIPGIYRIVTNKGRQEPFLIQPDRQESNLTPLTDHEWAKLTDRKRMTMVRDAKALNDGLTTEDTRTEIWFLLLYIFLAFLVGELLLTRQMVRGGHTTELPLAEAPTS